MDFGTLWKQQGFVTAKDTPIKNGELVAELLDAMQLPRELAIVKVKAYTKMDTWTTGGLNYIASMQRIPRSPCDH